MTSSRGWGAARAVLDRPLPCRGRLEGSDQLALQRDLQTRREMGERWARGGREVAERWPISLAHKGRGLRALLSQTCAIRIELSRWPVLDA